jgi:hypothetical protein
LAVRIRWAWSTFTRMTIGLFSAVLVLALFLAFNPPALRAIILLFPVPGVVAVPTPGPTPLPPRISAPRGEHPGGYRVFQGTYPGSRFGCTFLLAFHDGRHVGVGAAHATPAVPEGTAVELWASNQERVAGLRGILGRGSTFNGDDFTTDYVLWTVAEPIDARFVLAPDPRGNGEAGERALLLSTAGDGAGGSKTWPGVVMESRPEATWVQLDDSFHPGGLSGCPVVSAHTGRVIGMAVAGENKPPTIIGLHPVGSLVEKARAALSPQR